MDTYSNNNYNISFDSSTSNCTLILSCFQALKKNLRRFRNVYREASMLQKIVYSFLEQIFCLFMEKAFCLMTDYILSTIVHKYISWTRNIRLI